MYTRNPKCRNVRIKLYKTEEEAEQAIYEAINEGKSWYLAAIQFIPQQGILVTLIQTK